MSTLCSLRVVTVSWFFSPQKGGFEPQIFVVLDKVALEGEEFVILLRSPLILPFHHFPLLYTHLHIVTTVFRRTSGRNLGTYRQRNAFHFFVLFFTHAIFKLYICIPTNCTQLIYFINNTLKHMYCLKL